VEARERKKEGEEGKGKKGRNSKEREGGRKKFFSRQKNAKIV
jgi:hypothetical protein